MTVAGCADLRLDRPECVADCAAEPAMQAEPFQVALRTIRLLLVLVSVVPLALLVGTIPGYRRQNRRSRALSRLCRATLRALDCDVVVTGAARSGASLVVANHTSWLDVLAIAAGAPVIPLAKSEVADWPLIGTLSRRSGALFVVRRELHTLPDTVAEITLALRQGHRVQVFPEATTRCGHAVGEFYRSSFQAAINAAVVVQPVALSYRNGTTPTTAAAFVGDADLLTSVGRVLRMAAPRIEVRWLSPIPAIAGTGRDAVDRTLVAKLCENAIARKLAQPVVPRRMSGPRSGQPQMLDSPR